MAGGSYGSAAIDSYTSSVVNRVFPYATIFGDIREGVNKNKLASSKLR